MRNHGVMARDDRPMDTYALCTRWNRYPRLFEIMVTRGKTPEWWILVLYCVIRAIANLSTIVQISEYVVA